MASSPSQEELEYSIVIVVVEAEEITENGPDRAR
jgi:hypothetical protein